MTNGPDSTGELARRGGEGHPTEPSHLNDFFATLERRRASVEPETPGSGVLPGDLENFLDATRLEIPLPDTREGRILSRRLMSLRAVAGALNPESDRTVAPAQREALLTYLREEAERYRAAGNTRADVLDELYQMVKLTKPSPTSGQIGS